MPFRTKLGEEIFYRRYAQGSTDTWDKLCARLVDDVTDGLMPISEQLELTNYFRTMKCIPAGRYLYYAGRPAKFFNNCFHGDTEFITDNGLVKLKDKVGEVVRVLSPITGQFTTAMVDTFGFQNTSLVEFGLVRGSANTKWVKWTTPTHRWLLADGTETTNLKSGDVVKPTVSRLANDAEGFIHGMVFADGSKQELKNSFAYQLRLCGDKRKYLYLFSDTSKFSVTFPEFADGDPLVYMNASFDYKQLPDHTKSLTYMLSFIRGWIALDGSINKNGNGVIHCINKEAIEFFIKHAPEAGFIVTSSEIKCWKKPSNFGDRKPLYYIRFQTADSFSGFKVLRVIPHKVEEVFCVIEPKHHAFTLKDGLATGNCYAMQATDTREGWSELVGKVTNALMCGGGVGVDYSLVRPSGRTLERTGGIASGPIPLMYCCNELGRNVMQGGSRRSALWAGLNWQHEDIEQFLYLKNWPEHLAKLKAKDYNFPLQLDMTNISVLFDDDWFEAANYNSTKATPIFKQTVRQMMQTGEPGMCFNFGENANETLRNACTELTSSYDSDVCNLGSVNLGRIESMEELYDVTYLLAKFLVCGTVRADLPYDKVREVREHHRKIGVGLMGVHEWLLKRSYRYEMNNELRVWLSAWENSSINGGVDQCIKLNISNCEKFNAVAPSGTISILAGTTSGIEPLFTVAHKRRYLAAGTKWKTQYVIDPTAQYLMDELGVRADEIETAQTLASDVERRVKFQADIQDFVDMGISSTVNLPEWGSELNNEDLVNKYASIIYKYAPRLRGITMYPNNARPGQVLTEVPYDEAKKKQGVIYDAEEATCRGSICEM